VAGNTPDFKTIADFRKDNGPAIRATCRQFVMLCRQLDLFSEAVVAIDGSKFKAVNNRDKNFTPNKIQRRMEQIETSIDRYLSALDAADRQEGKVAQAKATARANGSTCFSPPIRRRRPWPSSTAATGR
jgi:transposase